MKLPENGLHDSINEAEYHGDARSLSSTGAKTLLYQGPRAYRYMKDNPAPYKPAFDFGSVVHALVLGVGDVEVVQASSWTGRPRGRNGIGSARPEPRRSSRRTTGSHATWPTP